MPRPCYWCAANLLAMFAGLAPPAASADFAPVTAEERALTAVPGDPHAPAVVLAKKGEFQMEGFGAARSSSILRIEGRIKILTEEGRSNGEIVVYHSEQARLQRFEGRTVLPDGRIIPVPADAKFVRKLSRSEKHFVTAVAFPAVQVGAILDYRYEIELDDIWLYLEPWYFSDEVPVLYSEIVYKVPNEVQAQPWIRSPSGAKVERETNSTSRGTELRVWARDLPAVATEPFGPPFSDLASQMVLLPTGWKKGFTYFRLFESWAAACELFADVYYREAHSDPAVTKKAKEIAGGGTVAEQASHLFRFVRDEIATEERFGIGLDEGSTVGNTFADRRGTSAEKALLLQVMLRAAKIESRLVWAADRSRGVIDLQLVQPGWFDTVLVVARIDDKWKILDPSDTAVAFGHLRPGLEGTRALIYDRHWPKELALPTLPFDANLRRAEIDLALDAEGLLSGTGTLKLTGQHAWQRIDWRDTEAETVKAWSEWLGERFKDFRISEVKVAEIPDQRRVILTWTMSQRKEEVLGDEATIVPSAPIGPATQIFMQPAESRKTPVIFDYAAGDEVQLTVRWPEGWNVAGRPKAAAMTNSAGELAAEVEVREAERLLVYKRRFDVVKPVFAPSAEYEALRSLFAAVEKSDAETLLLVRR